MERGLGNVLPDVKSDAGPWNCVLAWLALFLRLLEGFSKLTTQYPCYDVGEQQKRITT